VQAYKHIVIGYDVISKTLKYENPLEYSEAIELVFKAPNILVYRDSSESAVSKYSVLYGEDEKERKNIEVRIICNEFDSDIEKNVPGRFVDVGNHSYDINDIAKLYMHDKALNQDSEGTLIFDALIRSETELKSQTEQVMNNLLTALSELSL